MRIKFIKKFVILFFILFKCSFSIDYLLPKEKNWIKENKEIDWIIDKEIYPFVFYENNQYRGLIIDLIKEIENKSNLNFNLIFPKSESQLNIYIKTKKPFITTMISQKKYSQLLELNDDFLNLNLVVINRKNDFYYNTWRDLANKKVLLLSRYECIDYIKTNLYLSDIICKENLSEILKMLENKEADAAIVELFSINQEIENSQVKNIKIAGSLKDKIKYIFAVNKNTPILNSILLKTLDKIDIKTLNDTWINLKVNNTTNSKIVIQISILFLVIILSISIYSIFLLFEIHQKDQYQEDLIKSKNQMKELTFALVSTLESANLFNDTDTGVHIKRVNEYSKVLAIEYGCDDKFIENISFYASLHDIGKIGISDYILKKRGSLTEEEYETMKLHVEIGFSLIKTLNLGEIAENIIRYHHERWDGKGYTQGLKGEEIPLEARIVALADVYDALRMPRVYKSAFSHNKAFNIIIEEKGKHFDPKLVDIFSENSDKFDKIYGNLNEGDVIY